MKNEKIDYRTTHSNNFKIFDSKVISDFYKIFSKKTDQEIWQEFKTGNEGAFNYIYFSSFQALLNYGCQINHDRETIKDLIQDLFIDLRHSSQNLGDVKHIKAYLFKSIRRKILEHNKKTEKEQSKSISNLIDFEVIFSPEQQLINQQLSRDKQKILQNALNTLTTRQREAIFHYFYEGLGYEEIGIIMEISNLKSVRNLIYRSLNAMRKQSSDFGKVLFSFL